MVKMTLFVHVQQGVVEVEDGWLISVSLHYQHSIHLRYFLLDLS
ncbi:hypothetical protein SAMN04487951_10319 [Vreelandella arcis]|uniref:Uncharacterized protein n=1 Tax=Vreelandella arcis TaxID=416873 RepID=A0A1G9Z8S8_9GAMM|nr:hypothetical protein SAMN04487951_10319 [Halomonas arcis]